MSLRSVSSNAGRRLVFGLTVLFCAAMALPVSAQVGGDKDAAHARMVELVQLAGAARAVGNETEAAEARSELAQISASLGGDLPVAVGTVVEGLLGGGFVVPPTPSGVPATTTSVTNNTPVAIVDNTTVTSTVAVAGAGTYIWDVDLETFITHTFAGDLDMTLTSPSGTVVTLSTDNGGGNDDVFNGTVWDDQANPGGQVPYTSNNGMVTDHAYANLTLASPLVPEEAMSAFRGEDPNGTWTITISDDAGGDVGSLNEWTLHVHTLTSAPTETTVSVGNTTPVAITDNTVSTSTVVVAGAGANVTDLRVTVDITHTFAGDLDMTLMSPSGTVVTLGTDNGGGNDNVYSGSQFHDFANPGGQVPYTNNDGLVTDHLYANLVVATPLVPEESMGAFSGEDPNGTWTLSISDDAGGDVGTLNSWSLEVTTGTAGVIVPEAQAVPSLGVLGMLLLGGMILLLVVWQLRANPRR